jgi:hypothetical protein
MKHDHHAQIGIQLKSTTHTKLTSKQTIELQ